MSLGRETMINVDTIKGIAIQLHHLCLRYISSAIVKSTATLISIPLLSHLFADYSSDLPQQPISCSGAARG